MDNTIKLYLGDNLENLKKLPDNSVDSIVTDPPYGLSFMNKKWDYDVPSVELWKECYRVLKHGGHVLSFGGTRTYHRMVVNIEDAGFEIRDQIMWLYGSGFPKSHNIGKAIDKIEGNEREIIGKSERKDFSKYGGSMMNVENRGNHIGFDLPITQGKNDYEGWGTALKPANEPICVARKPLSEKTVAENVLKWGTGGINIDGCRVSHNEPIRPMKAQESGNKVYGQAGRKEDGRFPANVIHDGSDEVLSNFPETTKAGNSKDMNKNLNYDATSYKLSNNKNPKIEGDIGGSASRFFYCAKASQKDRNEGCEKLEGKYVAQGNQAQAELKRGNLDFQKGNMHNKIELKQNFHPTVKPTDLMRYLCRLVTPKNGIVLDPYMGSGSTGKAAILEGFSFIGMELDEEYFNIAKARIENAEKIYIDSQKQLKAL